MTPASEDGSGSASAPASSLSGVVDVALSAQLDLDADGGVTWSWRKIDAGVRGLRCSWVAWIRGWWSERGPSDENRWMEGSCVLMQQPKCILAVAHRQAGKIKCYALKKIYSVIHIVYGPPQLNVNVKFSGCRW